MKKLLSHLILCAGLMVIVPHSANAQWVKTNGPVDGDVHSFGVNGGNIFAGTEGDGVWRRPLSEMIRTVNAHPRQESGNCVHFKTGTLSRAGATHTVAFTIPHPDRVVITMHDLTGRKISSLVNQYLDAGSYRYLWDAHAFAQSRYVVRMQAGGTAFMNLVWIAH